MPMVMREKLALRPSETTSESMLKPRRENTWQMRISTPGWLLTRMESVCGGAARDGGRATGLSVVTMVWGMAGKDLGFEI
jgi:hypothetical protein